MVLSVQKAGIVPVSVFPLHCQVYGPRSPVMVVIVTVIALPTLVPVRVRPLLTFPVIFPTDISWSVIDRDITRASHPVTPDGLRLGKLTLPL